MTDDAAPRRCLYVSELDHTPNGFIPNMVEENASGYWPMTGSGAHSQPWYFGTDLETAQRLVDEYNAKLGITPEQATEIVTSSIRAQTAEDSRREYQTRRLELIHLGRDTTALDREWEQTHNA